MEPFQTPNLLQFSAYAVAIVGTIATIIVAWIQHRRSPHEAVAIRSEAIESLTNSVEKLTVRLNIVQSERIADCLEFDRNLDALRIELSDKYDRRLSEMQAHYEQKIARLEQGHRDRVEALKKRIKELESRVENGNGDNYQNPV